MEILHSYSPVLEFYILFGSAQVDLLEDAEIVDLDVFWIWQLLPVLPKTIFVIFDGVQGQWLSRVTECKDKG